MPQPWALALLSSLYAQEPPSTRTFRQHRGALDHRVASEVLQGRCLGDRTYGTFIDDYYDQFIRPSSPADRTPSKPGSGPGNPHKGRRTAPVPQPGCGRRSSDGVEDRKRGRCAGPACGRSRPGGTRRPGHCAKHQQDRLGPASHLLLTRLTRRQDGRGNR